MSFNELGLRPELLSTLEGLGFTEPTPVQTEAIPIALQDQQDLFVVARTGTGKTAAFGLPLLTLIEATKKPQALILSPTRELANQITQELRRFAQDLPELRLVSVFGGTSIERQIKQLQKGVSIIVATPGRLLDLARRGEIYPDMIRYLVLDEADEMLNMGFKDELDEILNLLPSEKRTWLFSATMAKGVKRIASRFMQQAQEIRLSAEQNAASSTQGVIDHVAYNIPRGRKYEALLRIIDATDNLYAMVFCRTRLETQSLVDRLIVDGVDASALHGDLSQALRDKAMGRFKRKEIQLLVATDIASRGIDVDELTHVFHYDLPENAEAYIHRSGRTGRAGHHGQSGLFVEPRDQRRAEYLARAVRLHIKLEEIPKPQDVVKRRLRNWLKEFLSTEIPEQLPTWLEELGEEFEIIKSLEQQDLIYHSCAQALAMTLTKERLLDLDQLPARGRNKRRERSSRDDRPKRGERSSRDDRPNRGERSSRDDRPNRNERFDHNAQRIRSAEPSKRPQNESSNGNEAWTVIEVSQGSQGGISERALKQKLADSGLQGAQIAKLNIYENVATFEVRERRADQALKSFKGYRIDGKKVRARRK